MHEVCLRKLWQSLSVFTGFCVRCCCSKGLEGKNPSTEREKKPVLPLPLPLPFIPHEGLQRCRGSLSPPFSPQLPTDARHSQHALSRMLLVLSGGHGCHRSQLCITSTWLRQEEWCTLSLGCRSMGYRAGPSCLAPKTGELGELKPKSEKLASNVLFWRIICINLMSSVISGLCTQIYIFFFF